MPTYVILMRLTDQGVRNIKDAPSRAEEGIRGFEAIGGKVLGFYSTMGEHDCVAIAEAPSDEVAAAYSLALGSRGILRTTTLRAFPREVFSDIVKRIP